MGTVNARRAVEAAIFPRLFAHFLTVAPKSVANDVSVLTAFMDAELSAYPAGHAEIERRLQALNRAVQKVLHGNTIAVVFLALCFAVAEKLDTGYLVLTEGSDFDRGYEAVKNRILRITVLEDREAKLAEGLAAKIARVMSGLGYFR